MYNDSEVVKEAAHAMGAEVCGIARVESFAEAPAGYRPTDILPGARSVIVFGRQFMRSIFDAQTNAPYTMVRNKLIEIVDGIALDLTKGLQGEGQ